jgi:hypothetical protein
MNDHADLELRLALESLHSAESQVGVAERGLKLVRKELEQAQVRYTAGVGPGLEVTEAQTRLERSRRNHLDAVFNYNQALIDFGSATGTLDSVIEKLDSAQTESFLPTDRAEAQVMTETACSGALDIPGESAIVEAHQPSISESSGNKAPIPEPSLAEAHKSTPARNSESPAPLPIEPATQLVISTPATISTESTITPPAVLAQSYAVQLGAFKDRETAERFQREMEPRYGAECLLAGEGPSPLWRVVIDFGPNSEEAKSTAKQLREQNTGAFFVVLSAATKCP